MLVVVNRFPGHANKQWALSKCFSHTEGQGHLWGLQEGFVWKGCKWSLWDPFSFPYSS